jgi:hypothetical protein
MKRQLEIVCLIVWVAILCVIFAENVPAAEPTPAEKMSSQQFVCVLSGGKWINDACVMPARSERTVPSPTPGCNPLICMITYHGKCVDGKCVGQNSDPTQMPSSTNPRH